MPRLMVTVAVALYSAMLLPGCSSGPKLSFKQDVEPILKKHCAECHVGQGEGVQKSGFRVDSYESVIKGTNLGPVVVAGDSASSSLFRLVSGKVDKSIQMPHGKAALSTAEITAIERWIDQGAKNN